MFNSKKAQVFGEYLISIEKKNKKIIYPFGKKFRKNLILDSFYQAILNGYSNGPHAFLQECRVGNSSQPAHRTDTGLKGTIIDQTNASTFFTTDIDSVNNRISLTRDFTFQQVQSGFTLFLSEACVGLFSSGTPATTITTSRFVFPGVIQLESGDIFKITYTLHLVLDYLNSNLSINITGASLDFSGYVRMSSNSTALLPAVSGNNTIITLGDTNTYIYRDFTNYSASPSYTQVTNAPSTYGAYQNIFGTARWANKVGFFDSAHTPNNYPNPRSSYTPSGPLASITFSNLQQNDTGSSIDAIYSFPSHPSNRTVGGIYLWHHDSADSNTAIYYKFTTPQIIPASTPITLKMRWTFNR